MPWQTHHGGQCIKDFRDLSVSKAREFKYLLRASRHFQLQISANLNSGAEHAEYPTSKADVGGQEAGQSQG
jgi:hypothetical protein